MRKPVASGMKSKSGLAEKNERFNTKDPLMEKTLIMSPTQPLNKSSRAMPAPTVRPPRWWCCQPTGKRGLINDAGWNDQDELMGIHGCGNLPYQLFNKAMLLQQTLLRSQGDDGPLRHSGVIQNGQLPSFQAIPDPMKATQALRGL